MPVALGRERTRYKRKTSPADFSTRLLLAKYTRPNSCGPSLLIAQRDRMYSLFTISNIRVPLFIQKADANLRDTGQKTTKPPASNEGKALKKELVEPDGIEPTTS